MQPEAWATLGVTVTTLGGVAGVWLSTGRQSRRVETKVDTASAAAATAATAAAVAVDNTVNVSNGYTGRTLNLLELIHSDLRDMRQEASADRLVITTHLGDHARAGLVVPAQSPPPAP